MKPYSADNNSGRTKSIDDIHHKTSDGGALNRTATAKAQRKAARQQGKKDAACDECGAIHSSGTNTLCNQ